MNNFKNHLATLVIICLTCICSSFAKDAKLNEADLFVLKLSTYPTNAEIHFGRTETLKQPPEIFSPEILYSQNPICTLTVLVPGYNDSTFSVTLSKNHPNNAFLKLKPLQLEADIQNQSAFLKIRKNKKNAKVLFRVSLIPLLGSGLMLIKMLSEYKAANEINDDMEASVFKEGAMWQLRKQQLNELTNSGNGYKRLAGIFAIVSATGFSGSLLLYF
jgi:hypothetical protein